MRRPAGERLTMAAGGKLPTDGGSGLGQNPFAALSSAGLPLAPKAVVEKATVAQKGRSETGPTRNRGRVDIRRETGNRGGKTVTVIDGFIGIGQPEKEALAKKKRNACGCGGTVKDGAIEIQGDQREKIATILTDAGFRPVFAGG